MFLKLGTFLSKRGDVLQVVQVSISATDLEPLVLYSLFRKDYRSLSKETGPCRWERVRHFGDVAFHVQ